MHDATRRVAVRVLPVVLALAGLACLAYAAATGGVHAGFFLVFPFLVSTSGWALLGMLLLMAALFAWLLGGARRFATLTSPEGEHVERRRASSGGVVLLGPVPLVWSSDRRLTPWLVGLAVVLAVAALALMLWPR
jgi:uncharacterized membrane protein